MSERYRSELERELAVCLEPVEAPEALWDRVEAALDPRPQRRVSPLKIAAALLVAAAASAAWYWRQVPRDLERAALRAHADWSRNPGGLDLRTSDPAELRDWMAAKAKLRCVIPLVRSIELVGARVLAAHRAAVFYRADGHPATLVIAAADNPATAKRIIRHAGPVAEVKVFTWQARGQEYALVSSTPGDGRRACAICHAS